MSIKDQCHKCRHLINGNCTVTTINYDGRSCADYKSGINLSKDETRIVSDDTLVSNPIIIDKSDNQSTSPVTAGERNIHGWLTFFLCFFVGFGSVLTLIMNILSAQNYEGNIWFSVADLAYSLIYMAIGFTTISAFYKKKCDAVFLGKIFVIICFSSNIISLWETEVPDRYVIKSIRSLFICCIWFIYLCASNQVNELFPKGFRKSLSRDYYWIIAIVVIPLLFVSIGIAQDFNSSPVQTQETPDSITFRDDEVSDGNILLRIPSGMDGEISESESNDLKFIKLTESETNTNCTISSYIDNEISKSSFDKVWQNWFPDDLDGYQYSITRDDQLSLIDETVFIKTISVETETPFCWEFALIYHIKLGKVCVISSFYSESALSPTEVIINNIRFL
jgi:NADH:ubiquinone oxidoreductase subunit 6 (subunit J)